MVKRDGLTEGDGLQVKPLRCQRVWVIMLLGIYVETTGGFGGSANSRLLLVFVMVEDTDQSGLAGIQVYIVKCHLIFHLFFIVVPHKMFGCRLKATVTFAFKECPSQVSLNSSFQGDRPAGLL